MQGVENAVGLEGFEFVRVKVIQGSFFATEIEYVVSDGELEGLFLVGSFLE